MTIDELVSDEALRQSLAPVAARRVFMAHAGVTALPKVACDAMRAFADQGSQDMQENAWASERVRAARQAAADLLGCGADCISLLGPTALGLNLVAHGLPWEPGDEVVYYGDDYPSNVYPWSTLLERGVKPVALRPAYPGVITWDVVEAALTAKTRLVALASCHFLSGYRIDVDGIGRRLRERGMLFSLDAIQTLGAFPVPAEHVDFISADSHKWLLGPCGAGIFYVHPDRRELLRPCLLGSWNVVSPRFVAQETIAFEPGGRRYEPGTLNLPGIAGMAASIEWLRGFGIDAVGQRILALRRALLDRVRPLGYRTYTEGAGMDGDIPEAAQSGIVSLSHPDKNLGTVASRLAESGITVSLRQDRAGTLLIRVSPHFYNTEAELDRLAAVLG